MVAGLVLSALFIGGRASACSTDAEIVDRVRTINSQDWASIGEAELRELWHDRREFRILPDGDSAFLNDKSKDCEDRWCCDSFELAATTAPTGEKRWSLSAVHIVRSRRDRAELVRLAQAILMEIVPAQRYRILSPLTWELGADASRPMWEMYDCNFRNPAGEIKIESATTLNLQQDDGIWTLGIAYYANDCVRFPVEEQDSRKVPPN